VVEHDDVGVRWGETFQQAVMHVLMDRSETGLVDRDRHTRCHCPQVIDAFADLHPRAAHREQEHFDRSWWNIEGIAGMHDFDFTRFVAAHPDSALATLRKRGVLYLAPRPSDSFPGMIALVTGALPKQTGVFYDDTWDRALSPAGSD